MILQPEHSMLTVTPASINQSINQYIYYIEYIKSTNQSSIKTQLLCTI